MLFEINQIEEVLQIMEYHFLFSISVGFGTEYLSDNDKKLLESFGVDIEKLGKGLSEYDKMFLLGRLTSILKDDQIKELNFDDFKQFIKKGQYMPLSSSEKSQLEVAKRKSYSFLKGLKDKSKQTVEGILLESDQKFRTEYEKAVSENLETGVIKRKALSSIVSDLGHKIGTWKHDWGRIVDSEMHDIFQRGRAEEFYKIDGEETKVYKQVYPGACRHCIRLYLKSGLGSEPKVFKLIDLLANGTNIGKKVAEWLAVVGYTHPYCRCHLYRVPKGYVWSQDKQRFVIPEKLERKVVRTSKIYVHVGNKVFET